MLRRSLGVACVSLLAVPAIASAEESDVPVLLSQATGVVSLLLAVTLLVVVLQLRKVVEGSAIAENVSFVVAASICFAASVLLGWVDRLITPWLSIDQVRAGADLLVAVSMFFFAVYFSRLARALKRFLSTLSADAALVASHGAVLAEDPSAEEGEGVA